MTLHCVNHQHYLLQELECRQAKMQQLKSCKFLFSRLFLSRPRPRPRILHQDQDQDQDFIFCPRGASRPRLWSRGLHHWSSVCNVVAPYSTGCNFRQFFFAVQYLGHPLTSITQKKLRRSSQGNPTVGGFKRKRGSQIQRFITFGILYLRNGARYIGGKLALITNKKSYMRCKVEILQQVHKFKT